MTSPLKIGPTPLGRQRAIINPVLMKWGMTEEELRCGRRFVEYTAARIEIARLLKQADFSVAQIARAIGKSRRTIQYYLEEASKKPRKNMRYFVSCVRSDLPDDVRRFVQLQAEHRGITSSAMIREWAIERARQEIANRTRAAA